MKIKEDLVYIKHTGKLIGYTNLGEVEQQLAELERGEAHLTVATPVLAFMLHGLCSKLDYTLGHFDTTNLSGEQLYSTAWRVTEAAEAAGFQVIAITADGVAVNRMHKDVSGSNVAKGVVYKTPNIYTPGRNIYFISDVPHLMKITRNC